MEEIGMDGTEKREIEYEREEVREDSGLFNWHERDIMDMSLLEPNWEI